MSAFSGGNVLKVKGAIWARLEVNIPLDPSRAYKIRFRYKQVADPPNGIRLAFCGFVGVKVDGVTGCDLSGNDVDLTDPVACRAAAFYWGVNGVSNTPGPDAWHEYAYYWQGKPVVLTDPGTVGGTASAPGLFHNDVRYLRPVFGLNVGADTDDAEAHVDLLAIFDATDELAYVAGGSYDQQIVDLLEDIEQASSDATAAKNAVDAMANDNLLTPNERDSVIRSYSELCDTDAVADIDARADSVGADRGDYDAAIVDLRSYMSNLGLQLGSNETTWLTSGSIAIDGPTFRDKFATAYLERTYLLNAISAAVHAAAEGGARVYRQATAPGASGLNVGDVWIDTDGGDIMYTWTGTQWSPSNVNAAAEAYEAATGAAGQASTALQSINGAKRSFLPYTATNSQIIAEFGRSLLPGDLWFQLQVTGTRRVLRWNGSTWVTDVDAIPLLKAAEADIADLRSNLVISNGFELNGFEKDGNGNVLTGARMYNPQNEALPCIETAGSGIKIGRYTADEMALSYRLAFVKLWCSNGLYSVSHFTGFGWDTVHAVTMNPIVSSTGWPGIRLAIDRTQLPAAMGTSTVHIIASPTYQGTASGDGWAAELMQLPFDANERPMYDTEHVFVYLIIKGYNGQIFNPSSVNAMWNTFIYLG